jgi:hypothetical protein
VNNNYYPPLVARELVDHNLIYKLEEDILTGKDKRHIDKAGIGIAAVDSEVDEIVVGNVVFVVYACVACVVVVDEDVVVAGDVVVVGVGVVVVVGTVVAVVVVVVEVIVVVVVFAVVVVALITLLIAPETN